MRRLGIAMLLFACSPATVQATPFTSALDGAQEIPFVGSPGLGSARLRLNDAEDRLTMSLSFTGLLSTTIFAHIHCCALPGANGPVAVDLMGFPVGVTAGSYNNVFDLTLASTYGAAFLAASGGTAEGARTRLVERLLAGEAYINIHTADFRPGEIRGQIAVPAPAMATLFGLGLLSLARRRLH